MRIPLTKIQSDASCRSEGYYNKVIAKGKVDGLVVDISPRDYTILQTENPPIKPCNDVPKEEPMRGLGDMVHKIAQPIAQVIDKVVGTHISQGCGGCRKRQEALNKAVPFK